MRWKGNLPCVGTFFEKGNRMAEAGSDPYELVQDLDYYWENGRVIFTARFLTKRGRCCDSGCRHCPYKTEQSVANAAPSQSVKPQVPVTE